MGLRGKNSRSTLVQIHYLVHILEIKPWPPSQSLRSLLSVFIQWENGERNSGSTNLVVPSLGSVIGEGKIEFKESFKLNVTLLRDTSVKGGHADRFKKNFLEIHLYESRREKTAKGQLLATATIDLADYGILEETISVCSPMSCKRSYGNTNQPLLFLQIQPTNHNRNNSSLRCTLSKECSLESNVDEPDSVLINEEYAEEAEVVSFTDDDISSRSSRAVSSSGFKSNGSLRRQQIRHEKLDENSSFTSSMDLSADGVAPMGADTSDIYHPIADDKCGEISSCTSSVDLHCDISNPENGQASIFRSANCTSHHQVSHYNHLSSSVGCDNILEIPNISIRRNDYDFLNQVVYEKFSNGIPINKMTGSVQLGGNHCISNSYSRKEASTVGLRLVVDRPVSLSGHHLGNYGVHLENEGTDKESIERCETRDTVRNSYVKVNYRSGRSSEMRNLSENKFADAEVLDDPVSIEGRENNGMTGMFVENEKSKHVRSVRSPADSARSRYSLSTPNTAATIKINESIEGTITTKDGRNSILDRKILQLEDKIKMLEGELREAASIEAALYSVVAEHGSSMSKVHAPARRLSRLYLHGHEESFHKRRAGAAKSAISGLVLVAKTCGNDVPR